MATTVGSEVSLMKAIRSGLAGVAQRQWGREPHDASVLPPVGIERLSSFARTLSDHNLLDWTRILGWLRPFSLDRMQLLPYIASSMFGLKMGYEFHHGSMGPYAPDIIFSYDELDVKGSHPITEEAWPALPEFLAFVDGHDLDWLIAMATLHFLNHDQGMIGDKLVEEAQIYTMIKDIRPLYRDLLKRGFLKESVQC